MLLNKGTQISHYKISSLLEENSRCEVYDAWDIELEREVVISVVHDSIMRDPQKQARLKQWAEVLISIKHSNIAALYNLEAFKKTCILVTERVEGNKLAHFLTQEQHDMGNALEICGQIAKALDVAHSQGLAHTELHPGSIMVTEDGIVKLLDFGLASALGSKDDSHTGTTEVIHYLSPEQLREEEPGRRTDYWSFGCILYETLTRQKAFPGQSVSEIKNSILNNEPDWNALPDNTPEIIRVLLRQCLQKDLALRYHGQSASQLSKDASPAEEVVVPAAVAPEIQPQIKRIWHKRLGWSLLGLIIGMLATIAIVLILNRQPQIQPYMRFVLQLPPDAPLALRANPIALSPDGRYLAYVAQIMDSTQLYVREMDKTESKAIQGTEGAYGPFFSPDGIWLGYFDSHSSKLKKIMLAGGRPQALCDAPFGLGASWGSDDSIIFAPDLFSGLKRVSAEGGDPHPLTQPESEELAHRWPDILPDGKSILFTIGATNKSIPARIAVHLLEKKQTKILFEGGAYARYCPTGHLIFIRDDNLLAVPFDLKNLKTTGAPFQLIEGIMTDPEVWAGSFSFSSAGSLAFIPGGPEADLRSLVWVDRQGAASRVTVHLGTFSYPRLSPDGRSLAVTITSQKGISDLWILNIENGSFTRLTMEGNNILPVWSPDGQHLAYASDQKGRLNIFRVQVDGIGDPELLLDSEHPQVPSSWSPDGQILVFTEFNPKTGRDIWLLPFSDRKPYPFLQSMYNEWGGTISPDGLRLAYTSDESGPNQVYVTSFLRSGTKRQISTADGMEPVWAPDGHELFYRCWKGLTGSMIQFSPQFTLEPLSLLLETRFDLAQMPNFRNYDISTDGQRFIIILDERQSDLHINVDINWFQTLQHLAETPVFIDATTKSQ